MRPIRFTVEPAALVAVASAAMLARQPVAVALPADWERPESWPVPIRKVPRGTPDRVQLYRPMAILESAEHLLGAELAQDGGAA